MVVIRDVVGALIVLRVVFVVGVDCLPHTINFNLNWNVNVWNGQRCIVMVTVVTRRSTNRGMLSRFALTECFVLYLVCHSGRSFLVSIWYR